MKLVRARVTDFKSIDDSGWVDIDAVTSMVGKNESGKTAFLGALKRLNPLTAARSSNSRTSLARAMSGIGGAIHPIPPPPSQR